MPKRRKKKKKEITRLRMGNFIYEYRAIIFQSRPEEKAESSLTRGERNVPLSIEA